MANDFSPTAKDHQLITTFSENEDIDRKPSGSPKEKTQNSLTSEEKSP